jgi:hypothetical protein
LKKGLKAGEPINDPAASSSRIQDNERKRVFEGETPQAYACGGGDASPNNRKRVFEGETPQAYACGGGDASPNELTSHV